MSKSPGLSLAIALVTAVISSHAAAVQYVGLEPLAKSVTTPVGVVAPGTTQVPMIRGAGTSQPSRQRQRHHNRKQHLWQSGDAVAIGARRRVQQAGGGIYKRRRRT